MWLRGGEPWAAVTHQRGSGFVLTETGSEVTVKEITQEAHSLVAAPPMMVCPEEFSVGSSRRSSGRCQTWTQTETQDGLMNQITKSDYLKHKSG